MASEAEEGETVMIKGRVVWKVERWIVLKLIMRRANDHFAVLLKLVNLILFF